MNDLMLYWFCEDPRFGIQGFLVDSCGRRKNERDRLEELRRKQREKQRETENE